MRALMLDPDILLLDEPLTALDPMIRSDLQRDLKTVFQRLQKTVLFVTHDMAEAAFVAGGGGIKRNGENLHPGKVPDLVGQPPHPFLTPVHPAQRLLDLPATGLKEQPL